MEHARSEGKTDSRSRVEADLTVAGNPAAISSSRQKPSCSVRRLGRLPWSAPPGQEHIRVNTKGADVLGDLAEPARRNGRE
jgi:hypothetical protein